MKLYTKAENRHYGVVKGFISSLPKEKHCKNVSSYLPCSSVTEPLEKPTLLRVLFVCLFSDGTSTLHFCGLQQNSRRSNQSNVLHYKRNSFFFFLMVYVFRECLVLTQGLIQPSTGTSSFCLMCIFFNYKKCACANIGGLG